MKRNTVYRFLRPTILVMLCYALAIGASYWLSDRDDSAIQEVETLSSRLGKLRQPDPSLQVVDVVRIQLDGLSRNANAEGILQCMAFASPDNVAVTGPLERFGRMVRSEKFRALASPDQILIGEPTFFDGDARVLVTMVNGKEIRSYIWVLSKQVEPPYEDCWMTEGVFPLDVWDGEADALPSNVI